MIQSESLEMPMSSYHEVLGDVEVEGFEPKSILFEAKFNESSTDEMLKNPDGGSRSSQSPERGDLIQGIEASDVSNLLEQFLEYEEKQGCLCASSSSESPLSSVVKSIDKETIALKIDSFVESHGLDFVFPCEMKNGYADSVYASEHSPDNGETLDVCDLLEKELVQNRLTKHGSLRNDKKCHIDNHSTDHNYACSGFFPLRKATKGAAPEVKDSTTLLSEHLSRPRRQKSVDSDTGHQSDKKLSNRTEIPFSKRQSSCHRDAASKKSRIPKRYRGPYCEDSSDGECSSSDDSQCNRYGSSDEYNNKERQRHKRQQSYSSDESSYCRKNKRRHSLYSDDSSYDQHYSSSDDDSDREYRQRYDPQESESLYVSHRRTSGSDRDSSSHKRRKRWSARKDCSERDTAGRKDKSVRDIELERKLGFKFDQQMKGTAKEERRIVYIGKIANKTTEDDIWRRFRPFGPIEKVTVHFRNEGDNYAFVTFFEYSSAAEAIEKGNEDSRQPVLDICFGGRRKFCGGSYVDFDSNTSCLEEQDVSRPPSSDEMDFDTLLRMSQRSLKDRKESYRGR